MIEQHEAMPVLLAACPSFSDGWREHVEEHGGDLQYVAAGEFARHLLALYEAENVASLSAAAAAIERLHVEGSPWVREFVTIGVLEGIQNVWSHNNVDPNHFAALLGPESRRWWQGLEEFWSGKAPDVRADA